MPSLQKAQRSWYVSMIYMYFCVMVFNIFYVIGVGPANVPMSERRWGHRPCGTRGCPGYIIFPVFGRMEVS